MAYRAENFLFIDGIRLYVFLSLLYIYAPYLSHSRLVALCINMQACI